MTRHNIVIVTICATACNADPTHVTFLTHSGGETTTLVRSPGSFEAPAPNLSSTDKTRHFAGDVAFEAIFEGPPATVKSGLGAQFNHESCASCHVRNGRGGANADPDARGSELLVRISRDGHDPKTRGPLGVEPFGDQLQDHAISGTQPEAQIDIHWAVESGAYADGTTYSLRHPRFDIRLGNGSPLSHDILTSPRIAPPVFGLGLLEAITDETLLSLADPEDADGDGISGRVNRVWNIERQKAVIGRFGWKANTPDLLHQAAGAYAADMGVTNRLHPGPQGEHDIDDNTLALTAFYTQTLAVPIRAALSEKAQEGGRFFVDAGCARCHSPKLQTGAHAISALAHQTIAPYTDLLLHDMGEALADNRPDFEANGSEWRTAPLWGIGLAEDVLGEGAFLHDGRARTLAEAILFHGGEAEPAREAFRRASKSEREALIAFLKSL